MFRKATIAAAAPALTASLAAHAPAKAQEYYMGQVLLVGFNFCPRGTMDADGRLLAIDQQTALFSLYGTTFGGDGRTSFGLPDLRGKEPQKGMRYCVVTQGLYPSRS